MTPMKRHRRRTLGKRGRLVATVSTGVVLLAGVAVAVGPVHQAADPVPTGYSIWADDVVPEVPADPDRSSVTVGVEFSAAVPGQLTGVKFYRSAENSGPHEGQLWSRSGARLGTVSFSSSGGAGWVSAVFDEPLRLEPGRRYVVSYTAPHGRYADDQWGITPRRPVVTRDLTAWRGVHTYGEGVPTQTWRWSNYYVDPVFLPDDESGESESPSPSESPSTSPSESPTSSPTGSPTDTPTSTPTDSPSTPPTQSPSTSPSATPTEPPTETATPTPTPTPSPTTPPAGGFPDAANTGVPAGTTLTPYNGPCRSRPRHRHRRARPWTAT